MRIQLTEVCVVWQVVLDGLSDGLPDELPVAARVHRTRVLQRDYVPRRLRAAHSETDLMVVVQAGLPLPLCRRLGPRPLSGYSVML